MRAVFNEYPENCEFISYLFAWFLWRGTTDGVGSPLWGFALGAVLVNVVHDELVVECPEDRAGDTNAAVERAMVAGFLAIFPKGSTCDLVQAHAGANWAEAKG